jgi:hypothetical protein
MRVCQCGTMYTPWVRGTTAVDCGGSGFVSKGDIVAPPPITRHHDSNDDDGAHNSDRPETSWTHLALVLLTWCYGVALGIGIWRQGVGLGLQSTMPSSTNIGNVTTWMSSSSSTSSWPNTKITSDSTGDKGEPQVGPRGGTKACSTRFGAPMPSNPCATPSRRCIASSDRTVGPWSVCRIRIPTLSCQRYCRHCMERWTAMTATTTSPEPQTLRLYPLRHDNSASDSKSKRFIELGVTLKYGSS